jgi:phosphatidylserine/phosphatidylglycerophosphate/cardiolipin synthase-like enzyme
VKWFSSLRRPRSRQQTVQRIGLAMAILGVPVCGQAEPDRIFFRDGSSKQGRVVADTNGVYTFAEAGGPTVPVRRNTVRFVVYGDEKTVKERLGIDAFQAQCTDTDIRILPAESFGAEILQQVQSAKKFIYMTTYSLSGSESGRMGEIFEALKERAQAGVKVYLIAPAFTQEAVTDFRSLRRSAKALHQVSF